MGGRAIIVASVCALLALAPGTLSGMEAGAPLQAPPNDDLADATPVDTLPFNVGGTTVGATAEPGEEADDCGFADEERGVWYRLEFDAESSLVIDTEGTHGGYDTVLSVWTGAAHPLDPVDCNDDEEGGELWSRLELQAELGVVYFVKVMGLGGDEGDFVLNIREVGAAEDNDNLSNAVAITDLPFERLAPLPELTNEDGEILPSCGDGGPAFWYVYTSTAEEKLALHGGAYGEAFDISAWTGSGHPLTETGCGSASSPTAPLIVTVAAGSTAYFRVAPLPDTPAHVLMTFAVRRAPDAPANDEPEGAVLVPYLPFETEQDTVWATSSPREAMASCSSDPAGGVWFRLVPETSGRLAVHALMSSYEVALSVWRAESDSTLTELDCRTRGLIDGHALAIADVTAGEELLVLADGIYGRGTLALSMSMVEVPPNDDLVDATPISAIPFSGEAAPHYATSEPGETGASCGGVENNRGVWFRITPESSGRLVFDAEDSAYAWLTLWTGGPGFPLTEVACAVSPQVPVIAEVVGGQTYYLGMNSFWLDPTTPLEPVAFSVQPAPERPANDTRAGATVIGGLPFTDQTSLVSAQSDPGDLTGSCEPLLGFTYALWYRITGAGQRTQFSARGDNLLVLSVYREGTEPPMQVACASGVVAADLESGASYLIRVASPLGPLVAVEFAALSAVPPVNDHLADAIEVTSLPFTNFQTTAAASDEPGEADSECNPLPENGVWYSYSPQQDARVSIDTLGSAAEFDTVLSVWTGAAQTYPLTPIFCNDDAAGSLQSRIELDVEAGDRIFVRAGGLSGTVGQLRVNLELIGRPPMNDNLANAMDISTPEFFVDQRDTSAASSEPEEELPSCLSSGGELRDRTVWYRLEAREALSVTLEAIAPDFDTVLSVWTGGPAHPLQEFACNNDAAGGQSTNSEVGFTPEPGRTYYVQVAGVQWTGGDLLLRSTAVALEPPTWTIYLNHLFTRRR